MASNIVNISKLPELRTRLLFTAALLAVYRLGVFITTPGVDRAAMQEYLGQAGGGLFSLYNLFTGGAMEQVSIFALGIMPYISASIIISLLKVVVPAIDELYKEGEQGMRVINQWTRYGTVALAFVQGVGMAMFLRGIDAGGRSVVTDDSWFFVPMTVLSLTAGTIFIMWLGEQITARGIGNGISLIIFSGIVAEIPAAIRNTVALAGGTGDVQVKPIYLAVFAVLMIAVIGTVVFVERGQRQIPVQYPKRTEGRKVLAGGTTHLPLRVNTSGVIPPIFASSLLMMPATLVNFIGADNPILGRIQQLFVPGSLSFEVAYVILIVFFTFFYTAVQFNPDEVAENLKKAGGYVPGIRPGKPTADHIDTILSRITVGGAIYLAVICVLPTVITNTMKLPFYFGGTSLLIVVGVALDTMAAIESQLISRHYEGFSGVRGGPRIRGRRDDA